MLSICFWIDSKLGTAVGWILHANKNLQTQTCRPPDHFGMQMGPTERISAFADKLIQTIVKIQKSYIKDTTDFINFIERKKLPQNTLLVTKDVTSLHITYCKSKVGKLYARHTTSSQVLQKQPSYHNQMLKRNSRTHSRREVLQIYK